MANGVKHLLQFGPYRVDPEDRSCAVRIRFLSLPKLFDLLLILVESRADVG
jgi:hypothetical protein